MFLFFVLVKQVSNKEGIFNEVQFEKCESDAVIPS